MPVFCIAQQAEKIYSISKKHFPIDYYHTQAGLWKKKIDRRSGDAEAWDNYYAACRMANLSTKGNDKPYDLDEIVLKVEAAIPNSFEYHKIAHWNTGDHKRDWHHLEKAYTIDPNRSDIYEGMVSHYVVEDHAEKIAFFNQKLFDSGRTSPGVLAWNYNQLMSVEDNAILLTYGDSDTYPAWMLQQVKGVQPNVTILNIHLIMRIEAYRNLILAKHKIPPFDAVGSVDFSKRTDFAVRLVKHLAASTNRPLYLGVGVDRNIIGELESDLYLTGMTFKYSPVKFDNLAILKNNIENKFMLDNLRTYLHIDHSESLLNRINANYLPAFVMLYKNYGSDENDKKMALKEIINEVAERAGMEGYLEHLMK